MITWLMVFLIPFPVFSQDINTLLRNAHSAEAAFRDQEALDLYREVLRIQPQHLSALCKASELYAILGKRIKDKGAQQTYYSTSLTLARKALQADPNSSEANFVLSVALGRLALIESGEKKVNAVKDIKTYAERSIQLDPGNYKGYHVLGKWHFEVSSLSIVERWLVRIAFGAFPESSFEESIRNYEMSRKLNPGFLLNYLEEAKALYENDDQVRAMQLLKSLFRLPNSSSDDNAIRAEARLLEQKWAR
jgi:tetratricopeptide (TPR) repeat protein